MFPFRIVRKEFWRNGYQSTKYLTSEVLSPIWAFKLAFALLVSHGMVYFLRSALMKLIFVGGGLTMTVTCFCFMTLT